MKFKINRKLELECLHTSIVDNIMYDALLSKWLDRDVQTAMRKRIVKEGLYNREFGYLDLYRIYTNRDLYIVNNTSLSLSDVCATSRFLFKSGYAPLDTDEKWYVTPCTERQCFLYFATLIFRYQHHVAAQAYIDEMVALERVEKIDYIEF
jgi:hypothetical protein